MLRQRPGWIHESPSWAHLPASDCARTERQTCLRISAGLPMHLKTTSYSDLSMVEQSKAVNLCNVRQDRTCEDIPTWTISCYTQHTTQSVSEPSRKPVARGTGKREGKDVPVAAASCHSLRRKRRTFWVQTTVGRRNRKIRCATEFNSLLLLVRSLDRASSQCSRLP